MLYIFFISQKKNQSFWACLSNDSPVPTGVLNHNVVILVDATHCAGGGEGLKHAVSPSSVSMLEGLYDLKIQIDVDQVPNLKATRISVAILLTWDDNGNIGFVKNVICARITTYTE